jgi:hypothetical protein
LTFTQTPITGVEGRASRKFLMREKERVYDFSGKSRQEGGLSRRYLRLRL